MVTNHDSWRMKMQRPKRKIRIAIVDDHETFRHAVRALVVSEPDLETVAELSNGHSIIKMLRKCRPDVLLLDLIMPGVDGIATLKRIRDVRHRVKIIVLTGTDDDAMQLLALRLGAHGYVVKDQDPVFLIEGIRKVFAGQIWLDESRQPSPRGMTSEKSAAADLSKREKEVVAALSFGLTNRQIGHRLGVSEDTVKSHLGNIFGKVGVSNRLRCYATQSAQTVEGNYEATVVVLRLRYRPAPPPRLGAQSATPVCSSACQTSSSLQKIGCCAVVVGGHFPVRWRPAVLWIALSKVGEPTKRRHEYPHHTQLLRGLPRSPPPGQAGPAV